MNRRKLVETLENLLTDEYDSSEIVYLTDEEIMQKICDAANWYMIEYNKLEYTP
jgi:hypothetical protein